MSREICLSLNRSQAGWAEESHPPAAPTAARAAYSLICPVSICVVAQPRCTPWDFFEIHGKSHTPLLTETRLESMRRNSHWGNKADDSHSSRKGTQRREQRNQVRQSRDGSKRNQEWSMKALEGGMNQNHNTCDHGNVIFICSETLFSKELLVHKRGGGGNKVNYIS